MTMKSLSHKILIVLVAFTLLFIWVNSMLPADMSGQASGWVQRLVQPVLDFIGSGRIQVALQRAADLFPERIRQALYRGIDFLDRVILSRDPSFLVRKAAHLSEYMLLGFLLCLLFVRRDGRSRFFLPELACLTAAVVDECIQLFSEGRAAQVRDVCIDLSGGTFGVLAALIVLAVLLHFHHSSADIGKNS